MSQFEDFGGGEPMECAVFEAMCPEAVDGTLTPAEQRAFEKHVAGCVTCAQELSEAQRGAAWLSMLKQETPQPPAALLARILAETTGAQVQVSEAAYVPEARDVAPSPWVMPVGARPSVWASFTAKMSAMFSMENAGMSFQPRLAMTAAMAFFSVALTLNMMGIRVRDVRAGLSRPASLERTFADASASATRSFQNLRVVYEVESRVSDMRNNSGLDEKLNDDRRDPSGPFESRPSKGSEEQNAPAQQQSAPDQQQPKTVPQGKSELEYPLQTGVAARKGA